MLDSYNSLSYFVVLVTIWTTAKVTVHDGDIIHCVMHITDLFFVLHNYPLSNEF